MSENTQKSRDGDRRRILEQELSNEQRSLEQAKRTLAEQETVRNGDEKNYQKVIDRLLDEESGNVADLEAFIGRPIKFQVEAMYSQEQYDVVLL